MRLFLPSSWIGVGLLAAGLWFPPGALAQTGESGSAPAEDEFQAPEVEPQFVPPPAAYDDIEEIIIEGEPDTSAAQAQDIAITEFEQADLDQLGIVNVETLQAFVPSLHVGQIGNLAIITLRGIGFENLTVLGEPGVVFEIDGVPQARPSAANALFFDVSNVQVSRGPQGTQGGLQSTGGRIAVNSAPPTPEFEAFGDFQYGSYSQFLTRGVVNIPIADEFLMSRFSAIHEDRDGYQRNALTAKESDRADDAKDIALRGQLMSRPSDDLQLRVIGTYAQQGGNGPAIKTIGPLDTFAARCPDDLRASLVNPPRAPNCPATALGPPGAVRNDGGPRKTYRDHLPDQDSFQIGLAAHAFYDLPTLPLAGDTRVGLIAGWNRNVQRSGNPDVDFLSPRPCPPAVQAKFPDLNFGGANPALCVRVGKALVPTTRLSQATRGTDLDSTNNPIAIVNFDNDARQYTLETFLESVEGEAVDFKFGFFHLFEKNTSDTFTLVFGTEAGGANATFENTSQTTSFGGYGEISWWLLDNLQLTGGLRYTKGTKEANQDRVQQVTGNPMMGGGGTQIANFFFPGVSWDAWTPKLLAEWSITDESRLILGATRGFKLGGYSLISKIENALDPENLYDAERVWSYELTSKNQLFDNTARLNVTIFWTDYDSYQTCQIRDVGFRCDVGEGTSRGVEVEGDWEIVPGLRMNANFNILDTVIDELLIADDTERRFIDENGEECFTSSAIGCSMNPLAGIQQEIKGTRFPRAPRFSVAGGIQYEIDLQDFGMWGFLTPRAGGRWQDRTYYRAFNKKIFSQDPFFKVDFRLTWRSEDERWTVEGFIDNATDVDVINSILIGPDAIGAPISAQYLPPRTWGLKLGFRY